MRQLPCVLASQRGGADREFLGRHSPHSAVATAVWDGRLSNHGRPWEFRGSFRGMKRIRNVGGEIVGSVQDSWLNIRTTGRVEAGEDAAWASSRVLWSSLPPSFSPSAGAGFAGPGLQLLSPDLLIGRLPYGGGRTDRLRRDSLKRKVERLALPTSVPTFGPPLICRFSS